MTPCLLHTDLPLPVRRGKVRDVYDLGDRLLIVATDRISAYDVVMPDGIPGKGRILTALTRFWLDTLPAARPHHLLSDRAADLPPQVAPYAAQIEGRFMLVRKARVIPIECVARGYLAGSGWAEYQQSGSVCGVRLPRGLLRSARLPEPIFTPATKEAEGHDQNITFEQAADRIGADLAGLLRDRTLSLYADAARHALARGIIIADTKFEFGLDEDDRLLLIDEALTPDSSRFWPADQWIEGAEPPSFDKQYLRNWLSAQSWNRTPPAPALPPEVVEGTRRRYLEAFERLTGSDSADRQRFR